MLCDAVIFSRSQLSDYKSGVYNIANMYFQAAETLLNRSANEIAAMRDTDIGSVECLLSSRTGLRRRMRFKCRQQHNEVIWI